jgi:hypothetical protein
MRAFTPSVLALSAGIIWVLAFTRLMPVPHATGSQEARIGAPAPSVCSNPMVIARLPEIGEASGLAISERQGDVLWTHNDSGQPVVYAIGFDGRLRGRVRVTGASVDDWEDVAVAKCAQGSCLYIADIGDNGGQRPQIAVYRTPEPAAGETATAPVEVFYGTYPDEPQDAESLFVTANGTVYVVTKGEGSPISLYRFPSLQDGASVALDRVATLSGHVEKARRITDADISADGKWVALRTLDRVAFHRAASLLQGTPQPPLEASLSALREPQGEGVALAPNGTVYLVSEAGDGFSGGTLARVSCKLPQ